ncbi:MAG: FAD:protein FMN transferase [Clostridia bacterium]|nr:FAD:protein FMN transferase [Clostridia bacterium]
MKKIITFGCAAILSMTVLCAACDKDNYPYKSPYFYSMGSDAAFVLPAQLTSTRQGDCYKLYSETADLLLALDLSLSATLENSYITAFNNAGAGAKVEINEYAYGVFSSALDLYEKTEGYYNPAVYYNVFAYGFGAALKLPETADELPSDEVIEKYNTLANSFADIVLSEENGKYYARKPETEVQIDGVNYSLKVDLGGIGKGYAVDKIDRLLDKHDINYGYFTFGASSIAFKQYIGENGGEFPLGLTNPRYVSGVSKNPILVTSVKNERISTSGDNVQYYEIDGTRYCHVIDPTTGKPVQTGVMTATVIGGSAAENDAFTTAIMAMGKDKAIEFIKTKLSNRRVFFTFDCAYDGGEGYEIYTNVPASEITVLDSAFTLKEIV